jgi:hypothetical protein
LVACSVKRPAETPAILYRPLPSLVVENAAAFTMTVAPEIGRLPSLVTPEIVNVAGTGGAVTVTWTPPVTF